MAVGGVALGVAAGVAASWFLEWMRVGAGPGLWESGGPVAPRAEIMPRTLYLLGNLRSGSWVVGLLVSVVNCPNCSMYVAIFSRL